jgi:hypothetical protein
VNGIGAWSSIAYFNSSIYTCGVQSTLKRFQFDFSNSNKPLLDTTPAAQTSRVFDFPGVTPAISANKTTNGIVWAYEYNVNCPNAVLHAYDPISLTELYNSGTRLGPGVKFAVPTISNGRVYIGTANFAGSLRALKRSAAEAGRPWHSRILEGPFSSLFRFSIPFSSRRF